MACEVIGPTTGGMGGLVGCPLTDSWTAFRCPRWPEQRRTRAFYYESFGHQDRERHIPMARYSIYRIYSVPKPFTALAAMMLAEDARPFGTKDCWSRSDPDL